MLKLNVQAHNRATMAKALREIAESLLERPHVIAGIDPCWLIEGEEEETPADEMEAILSPSEQRELMGRLGCTFDGTYWHYRNGAPVGLAVTAMFNHFETRQDIENFKAIQ